MCRGLNVKLDRKYLVLAAVAGAIVALDQLTKLWVHTGLGLGHSIEIIPGFFRFTYIRNQGAAFGIFRSAAPLFREIFFLSVPPFAMVLIAYMLKSVESHDRWQIFAMSLIFGGALGNYIDRLRFRYVIDFLDFHYKEVWSYPAFNVADSAIVIGVILLGLIMFQRDQAAKKLNG
jgi:signal peptidase II